MRCHYFHIKPLSQLKSWLLANGIALEAKEYRVRIL